MARTQCQSCNRALYFFERVPTLQDYCRMCASIRGLDRICDVGFRQRMVERCERIQPWWRWTVWLEHALLWD